MTATTTEAPARADWRKTDVPTLRETEDIFPLTPHHQFDGERGKTTPATWTHVRACRFGGAEGTPQAQGVKWNGDCYRYDIFKRPATNLLGHDKGFEWAMRWWNGSGQEFLAANHNSTSQAEEYLLEAIVAEPDETKRWLLCHAIYEIYSHQRDSAAKNVRRRYETAHLDGRLKIRKRDGRRYVEIAEPLPEPDERGVRTVTIQIGGERS